MLPFAGSRSLWYSSRMGHFAYRIHRNGSFESKGLADGATAREAMADLILRLSNPKPEDVFLVQVGDLTQTVYGDELGISSRMSSMTAEEVEEEDADVTNEEGHLVDAPQLPADFFDAMADHTKEAIKRIIEKRGIAPDVAGGAKIDVEESMADALHEAAKQGDWEKREEIKRALEQAQGKNKVSLSYALDVDLHYYKYDPCTREWKVVPADKPEVEVNIPPDRATRYAVEMEGGVLIRDDNQTDEEREARLNRALERIRANPHLQNSPLTKELLGDD